MGNFLEEKALGGHHQNTDSLEERVSVFLISNFDDESQFNQPFDSSTDSESDGNDSHDPTERTLYWESQEALLQELLEQYSLTGVKLRKEVNRIIEVAKETDSVDCLRRKVVSLLCDKGFNATICTSKWNRTKKFPGGSHEYIEVIASTAGRKKQIPYVIELEFKEQFEIAKACDEYRNLINQIPEYYIGKSDYLNAIVRVVCDAAKTSMKEKKIHIGPWRKTSFMQMKWSGSCDESLRLSSRKLHASVGRFCLDFSAPPPVVGTKMLAGI